MDGHDSEEQRVLHEQRKEVAEQIAQALGETEVEPRKTIYRAVKKLGRDQAQLFVQKTLEIELAGGLMLPNESRRRTTGGVFFFLIKTEVPADITRHIFPRRLPPHLKRKTPLQGSQETKGMTPPTASEAKRAEPPMAWEDRIAALAEITIEERGEASTVKVTLIGRPGRIIERGPCVVTTMQQQEKLPPLPKGLPIPKPEEAAQTLYAVYISTRQWKGVAAAMNDPEDALIIEGWQALDKQTESIAVYAMNTTTRKLQAAKRQSQQQTG